MKPSRLEKLADIALAVAIGVVLAVLFAPYFTQP